MVTNDEARSDETMVMRAGRVDRGTARYWIDYVSDEIDIAARVDLTRALRAARAGDGALLSLLIRRHPIGGDE